MVNDGGTQGSVARMAVEQREVSLEGCEAWGAGHGFEGRRLQNLCVCSNGEIEQAVTIKKMDLTHRAHGAASMVTDGWAPGQGMAGCSRACKHEELGSSGRLVCQGKEKELFHFIFSFLLFFMPRRSTFIYI